MAAKTTELLQKILADDQSIYDLVRQIDEYARGVSDLEYGLPDSAEEYAHVKAMIREWLIALVAKHDDGRR